MVRSFGHLSLFRKLSSILKSVFYIPFPYIVNFRTLCHHIIVSFFPSCDIILHTRNEPRDACKSCDHVMRFTATMKKEIVIQLTPSISDGYTKYSFSTSETFPRSNLFPKRSARGQISIWNDIWSSENSGQSNFVSRFSPRFVLIAE